MKDQYVLKYKAYKVLGIISKWAIFGIISFAILFPVYWIFISSITPSDELFSMPIDYLPDHPTLESYKFLIENVGLMEKIVSTVNDKKKVIRSMLSCNKKMDPENLQLLYVGD